MHRYVIPVCGYVAVMMTIGDPALARERSHHHRHHWTLKHSHDSWRTHATSHHARHWRSHRRTATLPQPNPLAVGQPFEGPFATQTLIQQPVAAPVVRQRRMRPIAAPLAWQTPAQQPVARTVVQQPMPDPYAPSSGWQTPVQQPSVAPVARRRVAPVAGPPSGQFATLVSSHAQANGLPESLVHRVIMRESRYNPRAISKGNYGIMQIRLGTARAMGYSGSVAGLLDANTNMTYAVRYLAGAYRAAGGNHNRAVAYYAGGYYYAAKRQGFSAYAAQARAAAPASAPAPVAASARAMVQPVRAEVF